MPASVIAQDGPYCTSSSDSVLCTDQEIYDANDLVQITGDGFGPNIEVTVRVVRPDGSAVSGDGTGQPWPTPYDTVTTGPLGEVSADYILGDMVGEYSLEVLAGPWNGELTDLLGEEPRELLGPGDDPQPQLGVGCNPTLRLAGSRRTYIQIGLQNLGEPFVNQGGMWATPNSADILIMSNDGGTSTPVDYTSHLNAGRHVLMIGGSNWGPYYSWISNYLNRISTGWHRSTDCSPDWQEINPHPITQFLPANYEFPNQATSYHMVHFPTSQPANTTIIGRTCHSAPNNNMLVSREYPSGGTFTYMALDLGQYTGGGTQSQFVDPFLQGYLAYIRSLCNQPPVCNAGGGGGAGSLTIGIPANGNASERNALSGTLTALGHTVQLINQGQWAGIDVVVSHPGGGTGPSLAEIQGGVKYIQISDWGSDWTPNTWQAIGAGTVITLSVDQPHPITTGLPASWNSLGFWHYAGSGYIGWSTAGLPSLISEQPHAKTHLLVADQPGTGRGVYIGWNVYGPDADPNDVQLLANAIDWAATGAVGGGEPYEVECNGSPATVQLDGSGSSDPDPGDVLTFAWTTNCPGGVFDDATSATPILSLNSPPPCPVTCDVFLTVDDGIDSSNCQTTVTVNDTTNPTISCPADVDVDADPVQCTASPPLGTPTANDNCGTPTVSNDAPAEFPKGTTVVTWTVEDGCGNSATCDQLVTVNDVTPPVFDDPCPLPDVVVNGDPLACETPVVLAVPNATDECPDKDVTVSGTRSDGLPLTAPYPKGETQIVWTASDGNGNSATCDQRVIVNDVTAPVFDDPCPLPDVVVNGDPLACETPVVLAVPNATDECPDKDVTVSGTRSDGLPLTAPYPKGETQIVWTASDGNGNSATCDQRVIVNDVTAPVFDDPCPLPDVVVEADPVTCDAIVPLAVPNATDECPDKDVTVSGARSDGLPLTAPYPKGETQIVWTASDGNGNSATCDQRVIVNDVSPPIFADPCPLPDVNVNADPLVCETPVALPVPEANDACPDKNVTVTGTRSDGLPLDAPYPLGPTQVIWTADDGNGNVATCTQLVIVNDVTMPIISCPPDAELECPADTSVAANGSATATDNCDDDPDIGHSDVSVAGCGATEIITRTWTATDNAGNDSSCDQTIEVVDTTDPVITCPESLTVECDGAGNQAELDAWLGSATASDTCGGVSIVHDFTALSDDCGATGSATVTWTATDDCNNADTCSATFTIIDTTDPVVDNCPAPTTVECDGAGNTAELNAWLDSFAGSDTCGDVVLTDDFAGLSDGCGETGSATVVFAVTDDCGLQNSCTSTFTIEDTVDKVINCPEDLTVECDGNGNQAELDAWLASATAADVCGDVEIVHDFTGLSDGCGATGSALVTWTATDDCDNTESCSATFTIEDTTEPVVDNCPAPTTVECDGAGNTAELNAWLDSFAGSDACGDVTLSNDFTALSDDCGETGTATVVFTVTDDCDLQTTCTSTFTIEDTTDPSIDNCPAETTVECDGAGNTAELDAWLDSFAASDICSDVVLSNDFKSLSDDCGETGSATVEFTATDDCDLDTSCESTFVIEDTTPPEITCPADLTIVSGDPTDPGATGNATATDVCDQAAQTIVSADEVVIPDCLADPVHFTILRTWTATDDCVNSSSCLQTITVERQEVSLIIKQGACPAPLNPNSNGVAPMVLTGDTDFDVNNVLLDTLRLTRCDCGGGDVAPNDGPPGPEIKILDLNHPFDGAVGCPDGPCACNADQSSDGIDDIEMKYRTDVMMAGLPLAADETVVVLSATGELDESAYPGINVGFIGSDCILIVPPGADPINATMESNVPDTYIEVTPLDLNVDSDGFANFGRAYFPDTLVTVTAPPTSAGRPFLRWQVNGVMQPIGQRTVEVEVTSDVDLEAIYRRPSRIDPEPPTEDDGDME